MSNLKIVIGPLEFEARLEEDRAEKTCRAFVSRLPFESTVIQARWSGEAAWVPLGDMQFDVPEENRKGTPSAGEILLYRGGISETEILIPYGETRFACRAGALEGNHFMTIVGGASSLSEIGRLVLYEGVQRLRVDRI